MKQPTASQKVTTQAPVPVRLTHLPISQYTALAMSVYRKEPVTPLPLPPECMSVVPDTIEESAALTLAWMAAYPKSFIDGAVFIGSGKKRLIWEIYSRPHYPTADLFGTGHVRIMEYFGLTSNGYILFGTRSSHLDDIAWYNPINDRFIDCALRDGIMNALENKRKKIAALIAQASSATP